MTPPIEVEPFLRQVFAESWELFKRDPALFILAGLVVILLGVVTAGILAGPLTVGFVLIVRARRRGETASVGGVFDGVRYFLTSLVVSLVILLGVLIGSALLFLPGLIVAFILMYAYQLIAYREAGIGESLKGSFSLVKEQLGPSLVLFLLLAILNAIGGAVVFGSLLTFPFTLVALTLAYEKLAGLSSVPAAREAHTE